MIYDQVAIKKSIINIQAQYKNLNYTFLQSH